MVVVIHSQDAADLRVELFYVIAVALLAKLAEAAQILADLGRGNVHLLAQGVGGDAHHALGAQLGQLPVVTGKPPDYSIRDIFFLQNPHSQSEPCHNSYSLAQNLQLVNFFNNLFLEKFFIKCFTGGENSAILPKDVRKTPPRALGIFFRTSG